MTPPPDPPTPAESLLTAEQARERLNFSILAHLKADMSFTSIPLVLKYDIDALAAALRREAAQNNLPDAQHNNLPEGAVSQTVEALIDRLENYYDFECEGGPLRNCVEWQALIAAVRASAHEPQERTCLECGALALSGADYCEDHIPPALKGIP